MPYMVIIAMFFIVAILQLTAVILLAVLVRESKVQAHQQRVMMTPQQSKRATKGLTGGI